MDSLHQFVWIWARKQATDNYSSGVGVVGWQKCLPFSFLFIFFSFLEAVMDLSHAVESCNKKFVFGLVCNVILILYLLSYSI